MPTDGAGPQDNLSRGAGGADRPDPAGEYELHPAALRPPFYPPWKTRALVEGIQAKGQQYAIEVLPGTRYVVRGWQRLLACRELGVAPLIGAPDHPLASDEEVEVYTAAESSGRDYTATEKALWTREVVLPAFAARAAARMAGDAGALSEEERGQSVALACKVTGASDTYVKNLNRLARERPDIYDRVRERAGRKDELTVSRAMELRRRTEGDEDLVAAEAALDTEQVARDRRPEEAIPRDLYDELDAIVEELDLSVRGEAVRALVDFWQAEREAWARFLEARRNG